MGDVGEGRTALYVGWRFWLALDAVTIGAPVNVQLCSQYGLPQAAVFTCLSANRSLYRIEAIPHMLLAAAVSSSSTGAHENPSLCSGRRAERQMYATVVVGLVEIDLLLTPLSVEQWQQSLCTITPAWIGHTPCGTLRTRLWGYRCMMC